MKQCIKRALLFALSLTLTLGCGCSKEDGSASKSKKTESKEENRIVRVACVGDSLTQGIGAAGWQDGNYSDAYPQQLAGLLGENYKVGNFGKGSSYVYYYEGRTENLWYPNTAQYSLSNQFNPDIVIIILGTNDARVMNNLSDSESFKMELYNLVEHYLDLDSKPEVYVANSITMALYDKEKEEKLKKYILPKQEEVARELGCKFIDLYDGLYDFFLSGDAFASDNLHPNSAGYGEIARFIYENLDLK